MPTIGVALAIPQPWGTQLQDYRRALGDETADLIPTHVTLVPPTEIAPDGLERVREHLGHVAGQHSGFRLHLRGTGTFRPVSPVVFVTVAEGISETEQLADLLREGPLDQELEFPYHPHVTVAHHLDEAAMEQAFDELATFEAVFDVTMFHLYVHDAVDGWRRTDDFVLQATDA